MLQVSEKYDSMEKIGYNIQDIVAVLEKYLPDDIKETDIKDIRILKKILLRNKREILKEIKKYNTTIIWDFELLEFWYNIPEEKRKERTDIILENNEKFINLCMEVYRSSECWNEKSTEIIADYKSKVEDITKKTATKIKERKLSPEIIARYNSEDAVRVFNFLKDFLKKSERNTKISAIGTLEEYIKKHKDNIIWLEDFIINWFEDIIDVLDEEYDIQNMLYILPKKIQNIYLKSNKDIPSVKEIIEDNKSEILLFLSIIAK